MQLRFYPKQLIDSHDICNFSILQPQGSQRAIYPLKFQEKKLKPLTRVP